MCGLESLLIEDARICGSTISFFIAGCLVGLVVENGITSTTYQFTAFNIRIAISHLGLSLLVLKW